MSVYIMPYIQNSSTEYKTWWREEKNLTGDNKMKTTNLFLKLRKTIQAKNRKIKKLKTTITQRENEIAFIKNEYNERINRLGYSHKKEIDSIINFYKKKIQTIVDRENEIHKSIEDELKVKIKNLIKAQKNNKKRESDLNNWQAYQNQRDSDFQNMVSTTITKFQSAINLYMQGFQYNLAVEQQLERFKKKYIN